MQRFTAILLFAAFMLPSALPLFALGQTADAVLPACCRRTGKHHCAMSMGERMQMAGTASKTPEWSSPEERCPYCPASVTASHPLTFAATPAQIVAAEFFSHPAGLVQTESRRRISRDRSRLKRGPPAISLG